jgi:RNA recognition motif-containing protein
MTRQAPGNVEQTIYVCNINYEATSKALWQVFGKFVSFKAVRVIVTFEGREMMSRVWVCGV